MKDAAPGTLCRSIASLNGSYEGGKCTHTATMRSEKARKDVGELREMMVFKEVL